MFGIANLIPMALGLLGEAEEHKSRDAELAQNARLAQMAALDAMARGNTEAGRVRMQGTQLARKQFVAYANSGVDPTQGTAARTQEQTAALSELDAQTVQNNAAREAWGFKAKASEFERERKNATQRTGMRMAATVLGTVGRMQGGGYGG